MVEVKNKKGNSAMWLAANGGHLEVVELLYSRGADIDSQDNRHVSCLMAAFKRAHFKVVKLMVRHVSQFPSDQELQRYITTLNDKDIKKKCSACLELIRAAKDKQALEAYKNATNLLKELEMEKSREQSKKEAATRRKQKRKARRLEKKQEKKRQLQETNGGAEEDEEEEEDEEDEENQDDDEEEEEVEDEEEETPPPPPQVPPPRQQQQQQKPNNKKKNGNNSKEKRRSDKKNSRVVVSKSDSNERGASIKTKAASNSASNNVSSSSSNNNNNNKKQESSQLRRDDYASTHEERDSGIDSNSQTSATSETTTKGQQDKDNKTKRKKKKKENSSNNKENNSQNKQPHNDNIADNTSKKNSNKLTNSTQQNNNNSSTEKSIKSNKKEASATKSSSDTSFLNSSTTTTSAANAKKNSKEANQSANNNNNGVVAAKTGSGITELDTFNDIPPSASVITNRMSRLNISNSSGILPSANARTFQDSVASLDTFGEALPSVPLIPLMSPIPLSNANHLLPPALSPKKHPSPRSQQDGWKEVNRKSKRVSVANTAISRIIGRGGCNINAIREASGAHIEVEKQGKSQGDRMVIIRGAPESTRMAQNLITALVKDPDKDLSELINKTVPLAKNTTKTTKSLPSIETLNASNKKPPPLASLSSSNVSSAGATVAPAAPKLTSIPAAPPTINSWVVPPSVAVGAANAASATSPKRNNSAAVLGIIKQQTSSSSSVGTPANPGGAPQTLAARVAGQQPPRSPAVRQLFNNETPDKTYYDQKQQHSNSPAVSTVNGNSTSGKQQSDISSHLGAIGSQPPMRPENDSNQAAKGSNKSHQQATDGKSQESSSLHPLQQHANVSLVGLQQTNSNANRQTVQQVPGKQQMSVLMNDAKQGNHQQQGDISGTNQGTQSKSCNDSQQQSSAPSFCLFDTNSQVSHNLVWGGKTENRDFTNLNQPLMASAEPLQSPVVDASRAPGYRSTASTAVLTNSVSVTSSSSNMARSAPGTPVASQNARAVTLNNNRQSATTPPPPPSRSMDPTAAGLPYAGILNCRTPPLTRLPPVAPGNPMHPGRSFTPPCTASMHAPPPLNRLQMPPASSLALGGAPSLMRHERATLSQQPVAANLDMNLLQQQMDVQQQQQLQQQLQQQQQQSSQQILSFSPLTSLMNGPQFTTPQTNTQPVFTNNMNAPISATHQIQSSLNPNAPDFSSRTSSFVSPPFQPRTQISQAQFQNSNNNNVGAICPPIFQNLNLASSLDTASAVQNLSFNSHFDVTSLLKANNHATVAALTPLQQSPQTSTPGSPTSGSALQHEERTSKLRPIGTERAQKRSERTGCVIGPPPPQQAPPPTNVLLPHTVHAAPMGGAPAVVAPPPPGAPPSGPQVSMVVPPPPPPSVAPSGPQPELWNPAAGMLLPEDPHSSAALFMAAVSYSQGITNLLRNA